MTDNNRLMENKLIAEQNAMIDIFMTGRQIMPNLKQLGYLRGSGPRYYNYYDTVNIKDLDYHSNPASIWGVVEKIESLGYEVSIESNKCVIWADDPILYYEVTIHQTKLSAVYTACVKFIKYWNELKTK